MAGLLEWLNTPQGIGLLSGVAGYAATARKGTPWNNAGRGAIAGLTGYQQAQDQIRQDADNKLAQQYRQMQMDQMKRDAENKRAMQSSLQALYKPAGTEPYKADNPFGEDLGNLQNETQATFGGKPVDPVMAAVLPYAQPDDILKLTQGQPKTSEMKNWEFAKGLTEDERKQFMGSNSSSPSTVQEWQFFSSLPHDQQSQYLEMKRNPQIMNLGGTQAVRAPGGGIGESYEVTPKQTDMPAFQAAQETAKVSARETVQRGAEASSDLPKVQANADNVRRMVQGVLDHPGFSSTVGVTAMPGARFIPGTKEADFMSRMDQLKGSAFLQAFETLKGGGQITEVEGKKATDAINRMSISTSENEFRQAAQDFLSVVDRAEQNATRAAGATATPQEQGYIQQRRSQGVPDSQIAKELNNKQAKQASGTFKDPIQVKNDDDYNNVPKGKYYKAPDGSIRVRK